MELKPGYKKSELGAIPVEWKVSKFSEIFSITAGGDVDPHRSSSHQDMAHPYPIYSNALTNRGLYGYCSYADHPPASITITARGTLGVANYRDHPYTAIGRVLVLEPKSEIAGNFFAEVINNRIKFAIESTGVPQLTAPQISTYRLAIAPFAEQCAIAISLSDANALIDTLNKLIAKKRDLKQAVMQRLLTGQTRLPNFTGQWEMVRASEIGRFRGGSGFPTRFQGAVSGTYPFFKVSDMNHQGNEIFMETANNYIDEPLRKKIGAIAFPAGSIVFAKVGAGIFLERKKILTRTSCLDNNMAAFTLDSGRSDNRFIHYVLLSKKLGDLVSTTALPSISNGVLHAMVLPLPPLQEQAAIATVLSDMDAEIAALEARRDKTRALKQGMMQELLTGRTRLI